MEKNIKRELKKTSLTKAIQILESFTIEKPKWGIRELGRSLNMTPATVHRLVSTLSAVGFLEQDSETQRYTLGPKLIKLASIYTIVNPLPNIAQKIFEKYSSKFAYNFYLGKLNNFELVYISVLDGRGPIRIVVEPGVSTTLHSTALGKVLLAYQDEKYIEDFVNNIPLIAYTSRSITDPIQLRAHLKQIKEQRYAQNIGEHYDEIGSVAVPIIEKSGRVQFGVSLAYPRQLIPNDSVCVDELVELAREIADEILIRID
jgi:IclR family KDG regulon transcriptional repressor